MRLLISDKDVIEIEIVLVRLRFRGREKFDL